MCDDDDWDIRPDFKLQMTEQEQRWGSAVIPGSGHVGHFDLGALRESVMNADFNRKQETVPKASYGYGGRFQVEKDRMDSAAVGYERCEESLRHVSQKDYAVSFGGKDANSFDYSLQEPVEQHESQKPQLISQTSTSTSSLRAQFEQLAKENKKITEKPARPAVGRLKIPTFQNDRTEKKESVTKSEKESSAPVNMQSLPHTTESEPVLELTDQRILEKPETTSVMNSEIKAVGIYDFVGSQDDELSFTVEEIITDISKFDNLWWSGRIGERTGIFPANFVREVTD